MVSSVQFSHSVMSDSLRPHESQHAGPPCPSPTPGVHSDSHPSSLQSSANFLYLSPHAEITLSYRTKSSNCYLWASDEWHFFISDIIYGVKIPSLSYPCFNFLRHTANLFYENVSLQMWWTCCWDSFWSYKAQLNDYLIWIWTIYVAYICVHYLLGCFMTTSVHAELLVHSNF